MKVNRPWPVELDELSSWIGSNKELVQGPGGNTSYKNGDLVWVKASGTRLEEASHREIFAELSLLTGEPTHRSQHKPSIEKFFHISNPSPYVAHVHSVGSMSVAFRSDAEQVLAKAENRISLAMIPYSRPGVSLEHEISKNIDFEVHQGALLGNHGLLVWGITADECKRKIILTEELFGDWELLGFTSSEAFRNATKRDIRNSYLAPDHAVFFGDNLDVQQDLPEQKKWLNEFAAALSEAIRRVPADVELVFLTESEVEGLRSWDSEIARKEAN